MAKQKTVKMKFNADVFYNDPNVPIFEKDEIADVPENMVARWLKRGAVIVDDTREEATHDPKVSEIVDNPSQDDLDLLDDDQEPTPVSNVEQKEDVESKPEKAEDKGHGNKRRGPRGRQ